MKFNYHYQTQWNRRNRWKHILFIVFLNTANSAANSNVLCLIFLFLIDRFLIPFPLLCRLWKKLVHLIKLWNILLIFSYSLHNSIFNQFEVLLKLTFLISFDWIHKEQISQRVALNTQIYLYSCTKNGHINFFHNKKSWRILTKWLKFYLRICFLLFYVMYYI